jgi:TPR repeat protein
MRTFSMVCINLGRLAGITVLLASWQASATLAQQLGEVKNRAGANRQVVGRDTPGERPALSAATVQDASNPNSQSRLRTASALVLGPKRSITDARKLFEKSARRGSASAQVNLGVMYAYGWGVPQNLGAALYWLKAGAEQGSARGRMNLGILYMEGLGVKQDYAEALQYFRMASEGGDAGAMVDLGFMSDSGLGVPVDHAVAAKWYRKAAERGNPMGQNNLADMYLRGEGVAENDALALAWFRKAADGGNTGARIKLGYMYATGRGTPKDLEAAYVWILAASLCGDRRGDAYLPELEAQLTAGQLERGKRRAGELQATPASSAEETAFVQ